MSLTVGSLFSGIGGFDLAAERVGWEIKWQVEIEDYCTKVLEKHWPHVRRYRDVRERNEYQPVDVLCGGFPCQDISFAGSAAGINGKRSGLWAQMARIVGAVRPRYIVVENVPALLGRGMGRILGDLAEIGYDAEWDCIPACAAGAPHRRDRVWIIATRDRMRHGRILYVQSDARKMSDTYSWGRKGVRKQKHEGLASAYRDKPDGLCKERQFVDIKEAADWWLFEPDVGRVAHGVPSRVDRLRGLGNAIVPQVAEWIFRQIQAYEDSLNNGGCDDHDGSLPRPHPAAGV